MNILLINPWITDFAAFDLWSKPLGLLYIGAFLRQRGHTVRLVDCMDRFQDGKGHPVSGDAGKHGTGKFHRKIIEKPDCLAHVPRHFNRYGIPDDLFREIVNDGPPPDVIVVTSIMTYWYHGVFEVISQLRELLPGVPVLLGGIYAVLCEEHARKHSGADKVVTDTRPSQIISIIESYGDQNGENSGISDHFAAWPDPAWQLYRNLPYAMIMTSRGCPMNCTVCASRLLFDGFERREPSDTVQSIMRLVERGVNDIAFADDALLLNADRYAAPVFEALIAAKSTVRLHTPNGLHIREITPALARLMKQAGMVTVRLSLETSSDERAIDFSGKVNRSDFIKAVDALYGAGFSVRDIGAYVLAGLPGQTHEEVLDTVAFAQGCGVQVKPALFSPVPGTGEFNRAVEAGMIRVGDDPVLQNNTLRVTDWFSSGEGEYRKFRDRISEGNRTLIRK